MDVRVRLGSFILFLALAGAAQAQEAHFANGMPVKGEIVGASDKGLEVKIGTANKTHPWETLSAATRYRYQIFYRANFDQVLKGISSTDWSNQPDQIYRPFAPAKTDAGAAEAAPKQAATGAGTGLALDQYESVTAMAAIDIPKLEIRAMELAQFWSVQYGPSRNDVAVFVFDTKAPGEMHDVMFVRTLADSRTEKLRGAKRTDKVDTFMEFRTVPLQSLFNTIKATLETECWFALKSPGLQVRTEVELEGGENKCSFVLRGTPAGVVQGNNPILTRELLVPPTVWFVLDTSSGRAQLVGNVRMGKMKLIPGRGMEGKLALKVMNSVNGVALDQSINVANADPEAKYTVIADLGKLPQNETYTIMASIDLGPLLGIARFEDKITIPKLGTK